MRTFSQVKFAFRRLAIASILILGLPLQEQEALASTVSVTTASVPNGSVGSAYSTTLVATGGTGVYTWSITAGSLPTGLSLGASTGVISGTPTAAGTYTFTAKANESSCAPSCNNGHYDSHSYTIVIASQLTVSTTSLSGG